MHILRVGFTVRRMLAAATVVVAIALSLLVFATIRKTKQPSNAVEALAHAARCAQEREAGFRLEDYDAEVKPVDEGFRVWFKARPGISTTADRLICYTIMIGNGWTGYCMETKVVDHP